MDLGSILKRPIARAILIQVGILVLLVGWFVLAYPRIERAQAAHRVAKREQQITDWFQSIVAEDPSREVDAPSATGTIKEHPQRLRITPSADDLQRVLGPPDAFYVDFRQGRHLIWRGTDHTLEASFDGDRLYCLRMEDTRTGHGELVFDSAAQWHPF
jgi:hypothetical protein